jgi:hypothetical protein
LPTGADCLQNHSILVFSYGGLCTKGLVPYSTQQVSCRLSSGFMVRPTFAYVNCSLSEHTNIHSVQLGG